MDQNTGLTDTGTLRRQARQRRHDTLATEIVCALRYRRLAAEEEHADELADLLQELPASR
jgi:hypothetical protein